MNENRAAIVVGGAGGIGSATCRRLAGEGHPVTIAEYNLESGQAVPRGRLWRRHRAIRVNVTGGSPMH